MKQRKGKRRQRYWTPRSPDEFIDSIIQDLKVRWKVKGESDVMNKALIEAYERSSI